MSALDQWRREIKGRLPAGVLRRDEGEDALFISDYPRRCRAPETITEKLKGAGFTVWEENGLAHLDGKAEKYRALMETLPSAFAVSPREENLRLYALAQRLCRT